MKAHLLFRNESIDRQYTVWLPEQKKVGLTYASPNSLFLANAYKQFAELLIIFSSFEEAVCAMRCDAMYLCSRTYVVFKLLYKLIG